MVIAGDDFEKRKPDPMPLVEATRALGAERCLYVGDSPIDAETAERAGMPFALYTEGIRTVPVSEIRFDYSFSDFAKISEIYDRL